MKFINTPVDALMHLKGISKTNRDFQALKVIAERLNMAEDRDKEAHWLFGKLFLYIFEKNLIHYKSSQGAMDSIRMALNQPMDNYFKLISDVFDHKITPEEVRVKLAEKINLALNDKKFYE